MTVSPLTPSSSSPSSAQAGASWWKSLAAYLDRNPEDLPGRADALLIEFLEVIKSEGPPFVATLAERVRNHPAFKKNKLDAGALLDRAIALDRSAMALATVGQPVRVGALAVHGTKETRQGLSSVFEVTVYRAAGCEALAGRVLFTLPSWWSPGLRSDHRAYESALMGACRVCHQRSSDYFVVVSHHSGADIELASEGARTSFSFAIALAVAFALSPEPNAKAGAESAHTLSLGGKQVYATGEISRDGWVLPIGDLPIKVAAAEAAGGAVLYPEGSGAKPRGAHRAVQYLGNAVTLLGGKLPHPLLRRAWAIGFGVLCALLLGQMQELSHLGDDRVSKITAMGYLILLVYLPIVGILGAWLARFTGQTPGFRFLSGVSLVSALLRVLINYGPQAFTAAPTENTTPDLAAGAATPGQRAVLVIIQWSFFSVFVVVQAALMTLASKLVIRFKWRRASSD